jgi:hypothetical protein
MTAAVAADLPHDLFAGWLLPEDGGEPVLLGPLALAHDDLQLPTAAPVVAQDGLFALEDRLQAAGYRSAMAVPIRAGARDAGILLLGSFEADRYDRTALRTLYRIAGDIATSCGRLAAHPWVRPVPPAEGDVTGALLIGLLGAAERSRSPADLLALTSDVLSELLPHDQVEIIIAHQPPEGWRLFSHSPDGVLSDPGVVAMRRTDALVHHFGDAPTLLIADARAVGLGWPTPSARARWGEGRAMMVTRLEVAGERLGWLCLGSDCPGWFREEDLSTLALAGRMLTPRVAAWKRTGT